MSDDFDPVLEKVFEDPLLHRPAPEGWIADALTSVDTARSPRPDMSADETEAQVFEILPAPVRSRTHWLAIAAAIAFVVIAGSILVQSGGRPSQTVVADAPADSDTPVDAESNTSTPVDFNDDSSAPDPPVPCLTLSSKEVFVGETISFANCSKEFDSVSWDFGDEEPLSPLADGPIARSWDDAGMFVVTLEVGGPGGTATISEQITVLAPPSRPASIRCGVSDFFFDNGVYTWSETWTWAVDPSIVQYEVEENLDGERVRLVADGPGLHRTDGANGQANSGRFLESIIAVTADGLELATSISNCGAMGGTGWVPPD